MHILSLVPTSILSFLLAWCLIPVAHANSYFVITSPAKGAQWSNGAANPVTWTKGLLDGVDAVDIEMARMSQDGLILVARDVPTAPGSLNIYIQGVPAGDDYYLLFLNSTNSNMNAISPKFAITTSSNSSSPQPIASAATVTVSGGPNPTAVFATTFPPSANGVAAPGWQAIQGSMAQITGVLGVLAMCFLGGAWTLL